MAQIILTISDENKVRLGSALNWLHPKDEESALTDAQHTMAMLKHYLADLVRMYEYEVAKRDISVTTDENFMEAT